MFSCCWVSHGKETESLLKSMPDCLEGVLSNITMHDLMTLCLLRHGGVLLHGQESPFRPET